ncbi:MAG: hypothetical protein ABEK12_03610 [Candidatus Nanohaloarchaea archaeon]
MGLISRVFDDTDWRHHLDAELVRKLEKLLKRVKSYEGAYRKAGEPKLAQIWVGLAEVFYSMERMDARLRKVEQQQRMIIEGIERGQIGDRDLRDSLDNY